MKVTMTDDELRAGIDHVLDNAALESLSAKIDEELWPELSLSIMRERVRSLTECLCCYEHGKGERTKIDIKMLRHQLEISINAFRYLEKVIRRQKEAKDGMAMEDE